MWNILPLNSNHDLSSFSCGNGRIDRWVREFAAEASKSEEYQIFVLIEEESPRVPLGICALRLTQLAHANVPQDFKIVYKRATLPVYEIAYLCVSQEMQGLGYGMALLQFAEEFIRRNDGKLIYIQALNEGLARLYERLGYRRLFDPLKLLFRLD